MTNPSTEHATLTGKRLQQLHRLAGNVKVAVAQQVFQPSACRQGTGGIWSASLMLVRIKSILLGSDSIYCTFLHQGTQKVYCQH